MKLRENSMASALCVGPLSAGTVHLCIDKQTLFAERTDWHVPWLERVLPTVARLAEARPARTVFPRLPIRSSDLQSHACLASWGRA